MCPLPAHKIKVVSRLGEEKNKPKLDLSQFDPWGYCSTFTFHSYDVGLIQKTRLSEIPKERKVFREGKKVKKIREKSES